MIVEPSKVNIVLKGSRWTPWDIGFLFPESEPRHFTECQDIESLMLEIGAYSSKSQARQAGRKGPIPPGWTELQANKISKVWIWNPGE